MEGSSMKALSYLHFDGSAIKELPSSIEHLTELKELYMKECKNLRSLPSSICRLKSLKILQVFGCSNLDTFPETMKDMKTLEFLDLRGTAIKELPSSIEHLHNVKDLFLSNCKNLSRLPSSICMFKSFERLTVNGCSSLQNLPEIMENMEDVDLLDLEGTDIKELPSSIQNLKRLRFLYLSNCKNLVNLPNSLCDLRFLQYLELSGCSKLVKFPKNLKGLCSLAELDLSHCNLMEGSIHADIWCLYSLERLNLSGNHMVSIPSGITQLCKLSSLNISHCKMLQKIPELPSSLRTIHAHDCTKLDTLSSPSSLLWSSLLQWFKPTSHEDLNSNKGKIIIIPGNGGIPGWILHQEIGSQVRIELPLNWYEDNQFLGFAFFSIYHQENHFEAPYDFDLRLRSDPDEVVDGLFISSWCKCHKINGYASDELGVTLYPKNAIPDKYHHNQPWQFLAAFDFVTRINGQVTHPNTKMCGVQLIYTHHYLHNNVHKLLDHQRGDGDARKNQADDQEPRLKRLRASNTDLKL